MIREENEESNESEMKMIKMKMTTKIRRKCVLVQVSSGDKRSPVAVV